MSKKKEKEERKLSKAELERKSLFEEKKEKLEQQGYVCKDMSIGVVYANIMAMVMAAPLAVLLLILFSVMNQKTPGIEVNLAYWDFLIIYILFMVLIVVHELIHGFTWGLFAEKHYKDISFGVIWSMLTPYCCCKTTLKKGQYLLGGIMPTIVLGILPGVYASFFGSYWVMLMSLFMVFGGGADLIIFMKLLFYRSECKEVLVMDHPYECGFVVFEK